MDVRDLFAANLRRIRSDRGYTQEELADACGIDRAHVSKIERSLVYVGLEIVDKFAKTLRVTHAEFFQPIRRGSTPKR